ncbi:hypothetical protein CYMTET_31299 [Cymbomonas tetramitiformis]|uniref:Uncharacterized protein n=1 Tax=Cymbomonas tetramitiformis TaxID=36881 RepID=A0AAE0FHE1_9CHLO|nr:hypothetical protein CYMTET_31299 [Cymbomonas tetramitiformis]
MCRNHDAKQTHDASVAVVCVAFALELLQGGTIFGWNALRLLLRDEDVYRDRCDSDEHGECNARDLGLQSLWTAGIFSLNFGAALTGPLMDRKMPGTDVKAFGAAAGMYGPLCTALLGSLLHLLAVTALLVSLTYGVDLYIGQTSANSIIAPPAVTGNPLELH